jgi:hypothetical protein
MHDIIRIEDELKAIAVDIKSTCPGHAKSLELLAEKAISIQCLVKSAFFEGLNSNPNGASTEKVWDESESRKELYFGADSN